MRPQLGSPPNSAVLTSGESATAARHALGRLRIAAAHEHAPDPPAPSPSATIASASARSSASSASPNAASSSLLGRDRHAARTARHQDHRVVGRQLAVDADPVERPLHGVAEQPLRALRARAPRRSARSTASSRSAARSSPPPSPARRDLCCLPADRPSAPHACRSRRWFGSRARNRSGRCRAPRPAPAAPPRFARSGSGTPITPVEATATSPAASPSAAAAASWTRAAASIPASPVAALALPEFATTARIAPRSQRSRVTSDGRGEHAGIAEAGGADGGGRVGDDQAEVELRRAGRPDAAGDPGVAKARRHGVAVAQPAGRCAQRE